MPQELAEIHGGFLSQLRKATTPNSMIKLSETFLNWREKFLIYGDYCANLTTAQDKIQEICNRSENINQLIQVINFLISLIIFNILYKRGMENFSTILDTSFLSLFLYGIHNI